MLLGLREAARLPGSPSTACPDIDAGSAADGSLRRAAAVAAERHASAIEGRPQDSPLKILFDSPSGHISPIAASRLREEVAAAEAQLRVREAELRSRREAIELRKDRRRTARFSNTQKLTDVRIRRRNLEATLENRRKRAQELVAITAAQEKIQDTSKVFCPSGALWHKGGASFDEAGINDALVWSERAAALTDELRRTSDRVAVLRDREKQLESDFRRSLMEGSFNVKELHSCTAQLLKALRQCQPPPADFCHAYEAPAIVCPQPLIRRDLVDTRPLEPSASSSLLQSQQPVQDERSSLSLTGSFSDAVWLASARKRDENECPSPDWGNAEPTPSSPSSPPREVSSRRPQSAAFPPALPAAPTVTDCCDCSQDWPDPLAHQPLAVSAAHDVSDDEIKTCSVAPAPVDMMPNVVRILERAQASVADAAEVLHRALPPPPPVIANSGEPSDQACESEPQELPPPQEARTECADESDKDDLTQTAAVEDAVPSSERTQAMPFFPALGTVPSASGSSIASSAPTALPDDLEVSSADGRQIPVPCVAISVPPQRAGGSGVSPRQYVPAGPVASSRVHARSLTPPRVHLVGPQSARSTTRQVTPPRLGPSRRQSGEFPPFLQDCPGRSLTGSRASSSRSGGSVADLKMEPPFLIHQIPRPAAPCFLQLPAPPLHFEQLSRIDFAAGLLRARAAEMPTGHLTQPHSSLGLKPQMAAHR